MVSGFDGCRRAGLCDANTGWLDPLLLAAGRGQSADLSAQHRGSHHSAVAW